VGFGVLTPVFMKSRVFWDITYIPVKANRSFGGVFGLQLQGRRVSKDRNQHVGGSKFVCLKRRLAFTGLCGVTSQKTEVFNPILFITAGNFVHFQVFSYEILYLLQYDTSDDLIPCHFRSTPISLLSLKSAFYGVFFLAGVLNLSIQSFLLRALVNQISKWHG
jgi:hypothetical protein